MREGILRAHEPVKLVAVAPLAGGPRRPSNVATRWDQRHAPPFDEAEDDTGKLLDDRYELREAIASSGTAAVYKAFAPALADDGGAGTHRAPRPPTPSSHHHSPSAANLPGRASRATAPPPPSSPKS